MLAYVYHTLHTFRKVFTRHATWLTFCVVVLGFLGSTQIDGVSSLCRFWHLDTPGYLALLHFFRSSAWSLTELLSCWWTFVWSQQQTVLVEGRAVLIGDHTMVAKDGRRMPGVVTLHQDSETQSKPNYFRGHFWGAIGLLVGTAAEPFCLPLSLRLHQGFKHLRQQDTTNKNPETSATRLVQMALDFAVDQGQRCILVLDAFFSVAAVFKLADSVWSVACKAPLVTILVRAKKSYVVSEGQHWPTSRPSALSILARVGREHTATKSNSTRSLTTCISLSTHNVRSMAPSKTCLTWPSIYCGNPLAGSSVSSLR